jgi:hypothetical protein
MAGGSHRVFQLLSTTKTGRHDIAEILLKVALKHQKSKSINPAGALPLLEKLVPLDTSYCPAFNFVYMQMRNT